MQARYYDPVIGRFYSNDPVGTLEHLGGTGGIHGFNRYAYANNNPYKYVDPDGKETRLVMQQEANTKDFLEGKTTREDAQKNSYEMAGGDVGKAIVENLTPMGLYMDVAESLAQGDAPLSEAAGVAGEKGAGAITDGIQSDLGGGGSIKAKVVKAIVENVASNLVQQGTEKIDELANKELEQN